MAAALLMEEQDFHIPISELGEVEFHSQIAWFRSWLRSTGFKDVETFSAHQQKESSSLSDSIETCRNEMQLVLEAHQTTLEGRERISRSLQSEMDEVNAALSELRIYRGTMAQAKPLWMNYKDRNQAAKAAQNELTSADLALKAQATELATYQIYLEYLREQKRMADQIQAKIVRMQRLELEFKKRNDLAAASADYLAWSTGKECTYKEPIIDASYIFPDQDFVSVQDFGFNFMDAETALGW